MKLYTNYKLNYNLKRSAAFIWDSKKNTLNSINKIKSIKLKLLIGIERQKKIIFNNTLNFAKGNITNNALLWGARGNGKSTLIKSTFIDISSSHHQLKIIQLNKSDIGDIQKIYSTLEKLNSYRFILFIDDLSFEKIDSDYKIIKSVLDGSIINQPNNMIIYVTSNRRHLMTRDMIDNERSSAIHTDESVEEKISLSDRFGIWLGFHSLSQDEYLKIIKTYCEFYNIVFNENNLKESIQWSLQRGNRTGRTAWQYITHLAATKNLKISI